MRPLISVHVAKAGGSSLLRTFQDAFGNRLFTDYAENPADPLSPRNLDPARYFARQVRLAPPYECVHGHFHPGKYQIPADHVLATILREPVENMISIYCFWKTIGRGHDRLHDYFLDQKLSILETCQIPLLRRLFSETYFGGFDMARFDLVGRHDTRDAALQKLAALTGTFFQTGIRENVTRRSEERQALEADVALRRRIEDLLADDVRFYERHAR